MGLVFDSTGLASPFERLWRNWIAHRSSEPRVGGSNPFRRVSLGFSSVPGETFFCWLTLDFTRFNEAGDLFRAAGNRAGTPRFPFSRLAPPTSRPLLKSSKTVVDATSPPVSTCVSKSVRPTLAEVPERTDLDAFSHAWSRRPQRNISSRLRTSNAAKNFRQISGKLYCRAIAIALKHAIISSSKGRSFR